MASTPPTKADKPPENNPPALGNFMVLARVKTHWMVYTGEGGRQVWELRDLANGVAKKLREMPDHWSEAHVVEIRE